MGNMELTGEMKNTATGDAPSAPEREVAVVASDGALERELASSTRDDAARA